jgi:hypothetical protein
MEYTTIRAKIRIGARKGIGARKRAASRRGKGLQM